MSVLLLTHTTFPSSQKIIFQDVFWRHKFPSTLNPIFNPKNKWVVSNGEIILRNGMYCSSLWESHIGYRYIKGFEKSLREDNYLTLINQYFQNILSKLIFHFFLFFFHTPIGILKTYWRKLYLRLTSKLFNPAQEAGHILLLFFLKRELFSVPYRKPSCRLAFLHLMNFSCFLSLSKCHFWGGSLSCLSALRLGQGVLLGVSFSFYLLSQALYLLVQMVPNFQLYDGTKLIYIQQQAYCKF